MNEWVSLSTTEIVPDRPFTHPDHTAHDYSTVAMALQYLRAMVAQSMQAPPNLSSFCRPICFEDEGLNRRYFLLDHVGLWDTSTLTMVCFFGQPRPDADIAPVTHLDNDLSVELFKHPGLLCYCTLALKNGNYGNVVLFASDDAKLHWSTSQRHAYAVRVLSPSYYDSIRLYNGYVPDGLMSGQRPVLERVKYLDYRSPALWRAVRELTEDSHDH